MKTYPTTTWKTQKITIPILIVLLLAAFCSFSYGQQRTVPSSALRLNQLSVDSLRAVSSPVLSRTPQEYLVSNPQISQNVRELQTEMQQIRVQDQSGEFRTVTSSLQEFRLTEQQPMAYIESNETYIDRSALPAEAKVMSGVWVAKCAEPGAYGDQVQFQLVFLKAFPVEFNPGEQSWDGSIRMKCVQIGTAGGSPPATIELKEPVRYNLTVNGKDFGDKEIGAINQEIAEPYKLMVTDRVQDAVELGLRQMGEAGSMAEMAPVIPYIHITSDKTGIQGYGIATARVNISLVGSSTAPPVQVSLRSDKGHLEPETVTLSGAEPVQTVTLRSSGTGNTVVSASVAGFITTAQTIRFGFPWSFLVSALIGGIIGTLIRIFGMRKEGFNVLSFIAGVLAGLLVALAYWGIGLNLLGLNINIDFMNEVAVLVLSALGGIAGAAKIGKAAGAE